MYTDHMFRNEGEKSFLRNWSGSSCISGIANLAWKMLQAVNRRLPEGELPSPKWAPGKMLKSYERSAPTLGFPRVTDSLCPRCVPEVRNAIIKGEMDISALISGQPGEIKAHIVEENGRVLMRKVCDKHGPFEDVLSTNSHFTRPVNASHALRCQRRSPTSLN